MNVIYARQPLRKSIFLAGPTPRHDTTIPSWRPEAIEIIKKHSTLFDGDIFVPEDERWDAGKKFEYDDQVLWEWEALNQATVVLFWIPRNIEQMPAFTTNVEFGMLAHSRKIVLGYPLDAPKMSYLHALAESYNIPIWHDLNIVCRHAIAKANCPYQKPS